MTPEDKEEFKAFIIETVQEAIKQGMITISPESPEGSVKITFKTADGLQFRWPVPKADTFQCDTPNLPIHLHFHGEIVGMDITGKLSQFEQSLARLEKTIGE